MNNNITLSKLICNDDPYEYDGNNQIFSVDYKIGHSSAINYSTKNNMSFLDLSDILVGDVFLFRKSKLMTILKYPYRADRVFISLRFDIYLLLSFIGIFRRLFINGKRTNSQIRISGIYYLRIHNKKKYFVGIKNTNSLVKTQYSFSLGYDDIETNFNALFNSLKSINIEYCVLRFYEKLPSMYRFGGDLDIIVSDQDWTRLDDYFRKNKGKIKIDMYGVSTPAFASMIPYYPPYLAKRILENKQLHSSGAYIPSNDESLLSFIFHCVYHKGYSSGLRSKILTPIKKYKVDNDYEKHILSLSKVSSIIITDITLEGLDDLLALNGWRPPIDSLNFYAFNNDWLSSHLLHNKINDEGFYFVVIRNNFNSSMREILHKHLDLFGFRIIYQENLMSVEREKNVSERLRGGNWGNPLSNDYEFAKPSEIYVIAETHDYIYRLFSLNIGFSRIRYIKSFLRKKLDNDIAGKDSSIHITDNSGETKEYINQVLSSSISDRIYHDIQSIKPLRNTFIRYHILYNKWLIVFLIHKLRSGVRSFLTKKVL